MKRILFPGFLVLVLLSASSCRNHRAATSTNNNTNTSATNQKNKALQQKYATLLAVESSDISNIPLYAFIDEWYGVPYKYGGKTKSGVDCSGLASNLYTQVFSKNISGSAANLYSLCKPLGQDELKEGDLVFFKIDGNRISHVGIYLQNGRFVHATTKRGVMINELKEEYYKKYYFKGGRLK
ncbi:MAG: lipoprotein Spr [Bacteroidetes bacterium]|nr:MAG: lipoprotein Spr [Bacteroidota bacterium]